jgi:hypothetical protein
VRQDTGGGEQVHGGGEGEGAPAEWVAGVADPVRRAAEGPGDGVCDGARGRVQAADCRRPGCHVHGRVRAPAEPGRLRSHSWYPTRNLDLATTMERIEKNFVITDPRLPDNPIVSQ